MNLYLHVPKENVLIERKIRVIKEKHKTMSFIGALN